MCLVCRFGSSEPMVNICTTIVLRGTSRSPQGSPVCSESACCGKTRLQHSLLASLSEARGPSGRFTPPQGGSRRWGAKASWCRVCVAGWEGCEPLARDFLNRFSPFKCLAREIQTVDCALLNVTMWWRLRRYWRLVIVTFGDDDDVSTKLATHLALPIDLGLVVLCSGGTRGKAIAATKDYDKDRKSTRLNSSHT